MKQSFSSRHNYKPKEVPITTREEAPEGLQQFVIQSAYHYGYSPTNLRTFLCRNLRKSPDPNNWSEYPNINDEVHYILSEGEWFYVYDVIEQLLNQFQGEIRTRFTEDINSFFKANGIGWQIINGEVQFRGSDDFEDIKNNAVETLEQAGKETSKYEINEAIKDLSKKPNADLTGAIQHSLAGLECVVREVVSYPKSTLGKLINDNPDIVPRPLDTAIEKLWGYTSNMGRHVREGHSPNFEEAELAVSISASLISYLAKKNFQQNKTDLPF